MKALITANLFALIALPLAAQTVDSPLVAAAKATNAARATSSKKPAMVITNDTLFRTGGHIGTSTTTASVNLKDMPKPAPPNDYAHYQPVPQISQDQPPAPYSATEAKQLDAASAKAPESHITGQQLQPAPTQQLQTTAAKPPVSTMQPVTVIRH